MIPASGAGGREFDSRITPFCTLLAPFLHPQEPKQRPTCVCAGMERTPGGTVSQPSRTPTKKCLASNEREKDLVRTGTRTQNLLLRRQAPYPLGHTDNYEFCYDHTPSRTRHSSLGVEHSLSKRKVVGSNPACGSQLLFVLVFVLALWAKSPAQLFSFDATGTVVFGWCSWLSRQSNTLKVPSSSLGSNTFGCASCALRPRVRALLPFWLPTQQVTS